MLPNHYHIQELLAASFAFFTALSLSVVFIPLAMHIGLVDAPGGRKYHGNDTPLTGGIAMFAGFLASLWLLPISLKPYYSFIAAQALLVVFGLIDDFYEISAMVKIGAQCVAALIIVLWGNTLLHHLGHLLFGKMILLKSIAIPFTVIAMVGLINAVNMTDGIDGLAGGLSFIEFGLLFFLSLKANCQVDTSLLLIFIVILLAFLLLNYRFPGRKQAIIFMGDSGSMFIGFALAWFCIRLSQGVNHNITPVIFLWIMAIPLFDLGGVIVVRLIQRKSPIMPGREHLHYVLLDVGLSIGQVTLTLLVLAAFLGSVGIAGKWYLHLCDSTMFDIIVVLFVLYIIILLYLIKRLRKNRTISQ